MFYFVSTVVIGFVFYLGLNYQVRLQEESAANFNMKLFILFTTAFPIFIGGLLRLPKLIMEIGEEKHWTFDWIKAGAIGIPALYVALVPMISIAFGVNLLFAKELWLLGDSTLSTSAGIVFGYILLDSVKK
ncbi:hypothetical protein [Mesobacillus subterraneus]|uniref:hypothetical protein n=1 Tax=Mesobacillus subterraneus TaxID=285983 RepID=UPI001FE4F76C|nr:hypothetical protein [Mesobacillus subterraneus]